MTVLPSFYIDNVGALQNTNTIHLRGNKVSDCYGDNVTGITVKNCINLRAKNNAVVRMRPRTGTAKGYNIESNTDVLFVYNVASRCDIGFEFYNAPTLNIYNVTTHDCSTGIHLEESTDRSNIVNASFSCYEGHKTYTQGIGIDSKLSFTTNLSYTFYYGLGSLSQGGSINEGINVTESKPIYFDEGNDALTPDNISILVNTGTANPIRTDDPDIGGIESEITDELTAQRSYHRELLDNTFWDVDNDDSVEVSLIKALQSRILANSELALSSAQRDLYIKQMDSALGFSEIYPMYSVYCNETKFKKRVQDMWFATLNAATIQALQNSIGGYNLFPSFFKRLQDIGEAWIIGQSAVSVDNVLLGKEGYRYGMVIDVLGTSTMSTVASGECYENVNEDVADLAPTKWNLHHYPQPENYYLFTDMWNDYEDCNLSNMRYNDDFNIEIDSIDQNGTTITPMIPTQAQSVTGVVTTDYAPSGSVEISLLDRLKSEEIDRDFFYRQGQDAASMSGWATITNHIGDVLNITNPYVQFKIEVASVSRQEDYEFLGLCLRPYVTNKVTTKPTSLSALSINYTVWLGGTSVYGWLAPNLTTMRDNSIQLEEIHDLKVTSRTDIWAAGSQRFGGDYVVVIMYWDGIEWTQYAPSGDSGEFLSLYRYDTNNIWVGGYNQDTTEPILYGWNGSAWNNIVIPTSAEGGTDEADVWDVFGFGANDLWICGPNWELGFNKSFAMNWDGEAWSVKNTTAIAYSFTSMWGTASNNLWFAGLKTNGDGCIYKWNGSIFTEQISSDTEAWVESLNDIYGFSATDIWSVGDGGVVARYDGIAWTQVTFPNANINLKSVWGNSASDLYVVGTDNGEPIKRYLYRYNGATWTLLKSQTTPDDLFYNYEFNVVAGL